MFDKMPSESNLGEPSYRGEYSWPAGEPFYSMRAIHSVEDTLHERIDSWALEVAITKGFGSGITDFFKKILEGEPSDIYKESKHEIIYIINYPMGTASERPPWGKLGDTTYVKTNGPLMKDVKNIHNFLQTKIKQDAGDPQSEKRT